MKPIRPTKRSEAPLVDLGDGMVLLERLGKSLNEWANVVLRRPAKRGAVPKRSWYLGHNGLRFARNSDADRLAEFHPEIYAKADAFLRAWVPARSLLTD